MASARTFLRGCPQDGENLPQAPRQAKDEGVPPRGRLASPAHLREPHSRELPCTLQGTKAQGPVGREAPHCEGARPPETPQQTPPPRGTARSPGGPTHVRIRDTSRREASPPRVRPGRSSAPPIRAPGSLSRGRQQEETLPSSARSSAQSGRRPLAAPPTHPRKGLLARAAQPVLSQVRHLPKTRRGPDVVSAGFWAECGLRPPG